jgi:hypothetical protein
MFVGEWWVGVDDEVDKAEEDLAEETRRKLS